MRAVVLRTRALGARHHLVAADIAALAAIVEERGRLAEAARLYERAIQTFRRAFGPRSYEVGVKLAGLAGIHQTNGRTALAERLYRQSLQIHVRLLGPRHLDVAITRNLRLIPLWIFHGDKDDVVSPEGSRAIAKALEKMKAPTNGKK